MSVVDRNLVELAQEVGKDVLTLFGVPTSTLGSAMRFYMRDKLDEGMTVLVDELRRGQVDALHVAAEHESIGVLYRYFLAARDGAASRNLRLLAKVMVGLAQRDRLYVDEFAKYSEICARLTRDQIYALGRLVGLFRDLGWQLSRRGDIPNGAYQRFVSEMVPTHFATEDHLTAVIEQLNSLGLTFALAWGGPMIERFTPTMEEIVELADFEELWQCEKSETDVTRSSG